LRWSPEPEAGAQFINGINVHDSLLAAMECCSIRSVEGISEQRHLSVLRT